MKIGTKKFILNNVLWDTENFSINDQIYFPEEIRNFSFEKKDFLQFVNFVVYLIYIINGMKI